MKRLLLAATLLLATSMALVACGGGDDDGDADGSPTASGRTTRSASDGTPAGGPNTSTTPGTSGGVFTPVPGTTFTPDEQTAIAGDITGGGPDSTPVVVSTIPVPTPAPGVTPIVDPTQIAPAQVSTSALELFVDMDAAQPGIQSSRDVNPGDTFRVAIVVSNVPPARDNQGGVAAFNFFLDYDKTKIVAPTIAGGPATERNPDLNVPELGGDGLQWDCLPAPEGDTDDPGGIDGDGNPATGQALLSCFAFVPEAGVASGTLTLAVVTFVAVASGTSTLSLDEIEIGDALGIGYAHCPGDANEPYVPCNAGTVNVR